MAAINPAENLVSLVLSSDIQAENQRPEIQLQPYMALLNGREGSRKPSAEVSRENGALWYIRGAKQVDGEHSERSVQAHFSNTGTSVAMAKAGTYAGLVSELVVVDE